MGNELIYEVCDGIAVITINRPERKNALNSALRQAMFEVWPRFESDDTAHIAILTAVGDTFCAGMDLVEAANTQLRVPPKNFMPVIGDNIEVTKPVIAAVQGYAYAGGWLLSQMCDLCVADDTALFAITEARMGRGMPWAAPVIHMLPQRILMEVAMTGDPLTAQRAYELGYVNRVTAKGQALQGAKELAARIIANAPLTVRGAKEMVRMATEMGRTAALRASLRAFDSVYLSEDALEGPRAFREKRKPQWKGK